MNDFEHRLSALADTDRPGTVTSRGRRLRSRG